MISMMMMLFMNKMMKLKRIIMKDDEVHEKGKAEENKYCLVLLQK